MSRFATILLLCLCTFACPIACCTGHCCEAAAVADGDCCQCCSENEDGTTPREHKTCEKQCLCKGAVLADFVDAEPPATAAIDAVPDFEVDAVLAHHEITPISGILDQREICCLIVRLQV